MPDLRKVEVRADKVCESDYIEWPANCGILRLASELIPPLHDPTEGGCYVGAFCEYDAYEYEWIDWQPVTVWRFVG